MKARLLLSYDRAAVCCCQPGPHSTVVDVVDTSTFCVVLLCSDAAPPETFRVSTLFRHDDPAGGGGEPNTEFDGMDLTTAAAGTAATFMSIIVDTTDFRIEFAATLSDPEFIFLNLKQAYTVAE